jgi:hypothetical protein
MGADIEKARRVLDTPPDHDPTGGNPVDTPKDTAPRLPDHEKIRLLQEKHDHELMDYEERCELWSRIAAARRELAKAKG